MAWYYAERGQQKGPIEDTELDALVLAGVVRNETLVWQAGMAGWQPHAMIRGAAGSPGAPLASAGAFYCAECGRMFPPQELVAIGPAMVCAVCKPLFLQRIRESGGIAAGPMRYAGFWVRFVARMIDGVLLALVGAVFQTPLNVMLLKNPPQPGQDARTFLPAMLGVLAITSALQMAVAVAYEGYFLSRRGATLGKLALDLKVVRSDGSGLTLGRAIGRYFASLLSSFTLLVGYIMAGFDDQKRALHDRICDTRVIQAK